MTEAVTQAEFARRLDVDKSYVTRLKQAGRLVLNDAGNKVLVEESLQRIKETADPNRDDVAMRHAAAKSKEPLPAEEDEGDDSVSLPLAIAALERASQAWHDEGGGALPLLSFQAARQLKMNIETMASGLEAMVEAGKLVPADDMRRTIADRLTTLRTRLEALPGILPPVLAAADGEEQIRALLAEHIEQLLEDLSTEFAEQVGVVR